MDALGGTAVVLSGGLAALTCLVVCAYSTFRTQQRAAEEWARVAMLHEEVDAEEEEEEDDDDDDEPTGSSVDKAGRNRMNASLD